MVTEKSGFPKFKEFRELRRQLNASNKFNSSNSSGSGEVLSSSSRVLLLNFKQLEHPATKRVENVKKKLTVCFDYEFNFSDLSGSKTVNRERKNPGSDEKVNKKMKLVFEISRLKLF